MRLNIKELERVSNLHVDEMISVYIEKLSEADLKLYHKTYGSIEEIQKVLKGFRNHIIALYEDNENDKQIPKTNIFN